MAHSDIFTTEWCDMVFQYKNQSYGAYDLRIYSSGRHIISFVISAFLFIGAVLLFRENRGITEKNNIRNTMTKVFSTVDLSPPVDKLLEGIQRITGQRQIIRNVIKNTPPVIVKDDSVREEKELKSQFDLFQSRSAIGTIDIKNGSDDNSLPVPTLDRQIAGEGTEQKPARVVQQFPEFPGGKDALTKYLSENLRYPNKARVNGIQGRVEVQFVVARNGKIIDVVIAKGVDESLDQEAQRLIAGMPAWIPGRINGKPVASYFKIPIIFIIQNN